MEGYILVWKRIRRHVEGIPDTGSDTPRDNAGMIRMLVDEKFDYTFVGEEEAGELTRQACGWTDNIAYVSMPDMPPSQGRFLVCTR